MIKVLEQAIEKVKALPEERQRYAAEVLEQIAGAGQGSIYATLSDTDKAEIDAALDELDRGEGVAWHSVKLDLEGRIRATRA
jgi:DNA-binding MurR/RpiR family transcriptional regulator